MGCTGWIHASYSPILRLIPRFKFDKRIIVYSLYFLLFPSSFGTMALISFSFFSWEKRGVNKKKENQVDSLVQIGRGIEIDPKGLGLACHLELSTMRPRCTLPFWSDNVLHRREKRKEEKKETIPWILLLGRNFLSWDHMLVWDIWAHHILTSWPKDYPGETWSL